MRIPKGKATVRFRAAVAASLVVTCAAANASQAGTVIGCRSLDFESPPIPVYEPGSSYPTPVPQFTLESLEFSSLENVAGGGFVGYRPSGNTEIIFHDDGPDPVAPPDSGIETIRIRSTGGAQFRLQSILVKNDSTQSVELQAVVGATATTFLTIAGESGAQTYDSPSDQMMDELRIVGHSISASLFYFDDLDISYSPDPPAPPVILNLEGETVSFERGGAPVRIDAGLDAAVEDPSLSGWAHGLLEVRVLLPNVEPALGFDEVDGVSLSDGVNLGSVVSVDGTEVGTVVENGPTSSSYRLGVELTSVATSTMLTTLIRTITFADADVMSDVPSTETVIVYLTTGCGVRNDISSGWAYASVQVVPPRTPPTIAGLDGATFDEDTVGSGPQVLGQTVTVTDPDSPDLDGGRLAVSGVLPEDTVSILDNAPSSQGNVRRSGNAIEAYVGGGWVGIGAVGSEAGESGVGEDLVIHLNSHATPTHLDRLVEALTYANTSDSPTLERTLLVVADDGDGPGWIAPIGQRDPTDGAVGAGAGYAVPALGDLDGDGDLDLVTGGAVGSLKYFRNDGSPLQMDLVDLAGASNPFDGFDVGSWANPALVDLDGDNDLDVVVGSSAASVVAYLRNDGTTSVPAFTEVAAAENPFDGLVPGTFSSLDFADLDGDGDLDAVVGYYWSPAGPKIAYLRNDGTPTVPSFTVPASNEDPFADLGFLGVDLGPAIFDADGDGDLDIALGVKNPVITLLRNDGTPGQPHFAQVEGAANPFAGIGSASYLMPALGDLNDDGVLDLVTGDVTGAIHGFLGTPSFGGLTVTVTPVNDAPTVTAPASADATAGESFTFSPGTGNGIAIADVDAGVSPVTVTIQAGLGTLDVDAASPAAVTGAGTVSLVITGPIADVNTALDGLSYLSTEVFTSDTLSIVVDDLGASGAGGPLQASATVAVTIDDGLPPTVEQLTTLADVPLDPCNELNSSPAALVVTFSEPMLDPPGDDTIGDVTNPASYRLVAPGPDGRIDTAYCGAAAGDDLMVGLSAVAYDDVARTATLTPGAVLTSGPYRLLACATLADLAHQPLDGLATRGSGGDFVRRFRVETDNAFANGHFDCGDDGWTVAAPTLGSIAWESGFDSHGDPESGALEMRQLAMDTSFSVRQCVPVSSETAARLVGVAALDGATLQLGLTCVAHATSDCSGPDLGSEVDTGQLVDSGSSWTPIARAVNLPPGTSSASCGVDATQGSGDDFVLMLDDLRLRLDSAMFADGFEHGTTDGWSSVVP